MTCPCGKEEHPELVGLDWRLGIPRSCWLYANDPAWRAGFANATFVGTAAAAPWPRWAEALRRQRLPGEKGVGDTLARRLGRGGEWFKRAFKRLTGMDCGCADRQARLNALYPYPPGEEGPCSGPWP